MSVKTQYKRIFGAGPTGIAITGIIWFVFYFAEKALGIPPINMSTTFRMIGLVVLLLDAVYLFGGGIFVLFKNGWGNTLVTDGPFQFIRHPFYSALIYSATGSLALWLYSWGLILSVIPLTIFWSWNVIREENYMLKKFGDKYRRYMEVTGQFFPMRKYFDRENQHNNTK